jgi:hypothetical protein
MVPRSGVAPPGTRKLDSARHGRIGRWLLARTLTASSGSTRSGFSTRSRTLGRRRRPSIAPRQARRAGDLRQRGRVRGRWTRVGRNESGRLATTRDQRCGRCGCRPLRCRRVGQRRADARGTDGRCWRARRCCGLRSRSRVRDLRRRSAGDAVYGELSGARCGLITYASYARLAEAADYRHGYPLDALGAFSASIEDSWCQRLPRPRPGALWTAGSLGASRHDRAD